MDCCWLLPKQRDTQAPTTNAWRSRRDFLSRPVAASEWVRSRSVGSIMEWKLQVLTCATHAKKCYISFRIAMFIYTREDGMFSGLWPDYRHFGSLKCSFDGVARPSIGQSYQRSTTCQLSNESSSRYTRSRLENG